MSTLSKQTADDIIAGKYADDQPTRIVEFTNAWGKKAYGLTCGREDKNKYLYESEYIRNPQIYWDAEGTGEPSVCPVCEDAACEVKSMECGK